MNQKNNLKETSSSITGQAMRYDGLFIDSELFRNYLGQHEFTENDALAPEQWVISQAYPNAPRNLRRVHFMSEARHLTGINVQELNRQTPPSAAFLKKVKEIDPAAKIMTVGTFTKDEILGFTPESSQPTALSEEEAQNLTNRRTGLITGPEKPKTSRIDVAALRAQGHFSKPAP